MTPAEHYRAAERLLAEARPIAIVTAPDNITQDQADAIKADLEDAGLVDPIVLPESIRVDVSGILAAAQVHATLAVAGSQMRSLGIEDE